MHTPVYSLYTCLVPGKGFQQCPPPFPDVSEPNPASSRSLLSTLTSTTFSLPLCYFSCPSPTTSKLDMTRTYQFLILNCHWSAYLQHRSLIHGARCLSLLYPELPLPPFLPSFLKNIIRRQASEPCGSIH